MEINKTAIYKLEKIAVFKHFWSLKLNYKKINIFWLI